MESDPVFVLGMPRCRTAWLSLCLSSLGCDVSHEGMRDLDGFYDWEDDLNDRLRAGPAGDSDPALALWVDDLLQLWPDAKFIVIEREENSALAAFVAAVPDSHKASARNGWDSYLAAFKGACDRLRASCAACRFYAFEDLSSEVVLLELAEFATGKEPSLLWARRMERLRVTSKVEPSECNLLPKIAAPIEVPVSDEFDSEGLTARQYLNSDFREVADWWLDHTGSLLSQAALPPLGVVVEDNGVPVAALWCYESFGVPVAELAFPVTRPGIAPRDAHAALCYAVSACIACAGKAYLPEASFRTFKTFAPVGMIPHLERLGFKESLTKRAAMTLTL